MWQDENVFYQIYPLGLCGAPLENDNITVSRLEKLFDWVDYLADFGVGAVLFNPVFSSDRHGYDTRDFSKIDCRLGTNDDFKRLCEKIHNKGMRVVLDGVFNHVGRGFWAFEDVLKNREQSAYKDWFYVRFDQNNGYGDNLSYEGWEGHYELVKLNLKNPAVVEHIFWAIRQWVECFDIDGLRLDVAYCLDRDFMRRLRGFCDSLKSDFCLIGEMLFGDYNQIVNQSMLHSCTNYECYKGIHSSLNSMNLFEIAHSLNRQFGNENWTLYKGLHLLSFVDNHDVSRISSILNDKRHIPLAFGLIFAFSGIPCIYYGSEWGINGDKREGDNALRPCIDKPIKNELSALVSCLAKLRKEYKSLCYGSFKNITITNKQLVFERVCDGERILFALNASDTPFPFGSAINAPAIELITNSAVNLDANYTLSPFSIAFFKL